MTSTDQSSSEKRAGDPWRNYRVGVGVLNAVVGLFIGYVLYVVQVVFAFIGAVIALLTMSNMGGSPPSMSTDPTGLTIAMGVIGLAIFGAAGYRFARNGSDGRALSWIAAIISLPLGIGIYSIWVLKKTEIVNT